MANQRCCPALVHVIHGMKRNIVSLRDPRSSHEITYDELLEKFFDFIHPGFALRTMFSSTRFGQFIELFQQFFLLVREFDRRLNQNMTKQIARPSDMIRIWAPSPMETLKSPPGV